MIEVEPILAALGQLYPANPHSPLTADLEAAAADAYDRLIGPAIEREIRRDLKEWADAHAINVFATARCDSGRTSVSW